MEFPHLGEHCSLSECNQLDFLPFLCSACSQVFCKDHFTFKNHSCLKATENDHQIPMCPICNVCVSFKYGDSPDVYMNKHIEQECSAKNKNKIYKNKCSMINCRDKVMIEIICDGCNSNFCLRHRHYDDHNCNKKYLNQKNPFVDNRTNATIQRLMNNGLNKTTNFVQKLSNNITNLVNTPNTPNSTPTNQSNFRSNQNRSNHSNVQGSLNEDEALAIAIQQSLNDQNKATSVAQGTQNNPIVLQDDEDENLRRAIEESKREYERNKEKCTVS